MDGNLYDNETKEISYWMALLSDALDFDDDHDFNTALPCGLFVLQLLITHSYG